MNDPQKSHLDVVKQILRYLKHTAEMGILFKLGGSNTIEGFTDADWAGDQESMKHATSST